MDVIEAVRTRLDVREYSDETVEDATKEAILDAGRLASSGRNVQHWRFILIDDDKDLSELADASPTGSWVGDAAFAIVICTDPSYDFHEIDAGRAVTYMQLVAWGEGIGSCIYTVDRTGIEELLEIPNEYDLTLVAGFGYPKREIEGMKDREPLEEIAYGSAFGEGLEL